MTKIVDRGGDKSAGEKLQIAILTFGMTGAGFALLTVVLSLFLNPAAALRVEKDKKDLDELAKMLRAPENRNLRAQYLVNEAQDRSKGLREIVFDRMRARGLDNQNFPPAKTTPIKGLDKIEQQVTLRPGKLRSLLQFIADVKESKQTTQVESVNITRDRRATGDDKDSWTATARFVDYVRKDQAGAAKPAAAALPGKTSPAGVAPPTAPGTTPGVAPIAPASASGTPGTPTAPGTASAAPAPASGTPGTAPAPGAAPTAPGTAPAAPTPATAPGASPAPPAPGPAPSAPAASKPPAAARVPAEPSTVEE